MINAGAYPASVVVDSVGKRVYGAGSQPGSSGPGDSDVSVVSSGKL